MPQIPLLSGIGTDSSADFRTTYPVNLIPVPKDTGISKGYLRFAPGLVEFGTGPGIDRGGINWADVCYRVMGGSLVRVASDGAVTTIGAVAGSDQVSLDYSFDYLCAVGGGNAYLSTPTAVTRITDPDVGSPIDGIWIDGYFLFTDGTFLYVTELSDPFAIDPLKYGSSEADPDRVVGLIKLRNEAYAFNRYTTEVFNNVGGSGFPFTRVDGAVIPKGCVGTHAKTLYSETIAWVGSGRNEPCSVYLASGGSAVKVSTREVEIRLAQYTEAQLADIVVEARADRFHQHLLIHLPSETLVYDGSASAATGQPVWFFLSTGVAGINAYRARNFVWCYGRWICGDTEDARIGYIDESLVTQYGEIPGWQFDTMAVYNASKGAVVWSLELVGTTGRAALDETPTVFHSYSVDGLDWSDEKQASMGRQGQTQQRVIFRRRGKMRNFRFERFRGANATPISWARLEAELEALSV